MWMAGYASRTKPSDGVMQDLFAKALALEDDAGCRVVIVTMDLIGIPADLRKAVEDGAGEKYKLAPEFILLNASHTHCGPEFRLGGWRYLEGMEHKVAEATEYGEMLKNKLLQVIGEALQKLAPSQVHYNRARCGFAMNRRLPRLNTYSNSPYPDGPVDHDVPVLEVSSSDGKQLTAVLFGYACHNTTLSVQQFCGDYAGYAQEELQKAHPGAVALFMMGCGGDQNPYPRREIPYVKDHGKTLALAVETALQVVPKKPLPGPLKAAFQRVPLAFATPPTKEQLEQRAKGQNKAEADHAKRLLAILANQGKIETDYPYPVQVIHFGNQIGLVTLGGEVVVDYSLRIKRELGMPTVWVAGYSNDVMGYIPSLRVLKEGGYEAGGAMLFGSHPGPWSDKVEDTIIGKVMELHGKLKGGN
jgi:neutral ceramidase